MALADTLNGLKQSVKSGFIEVSLLFNKLFSENESRKTEISDIQTTVSQLPTKSYVDDAVSGSTQIDDSATSATKTWSSEKINQKDETNKTAIDQVKGQIGDLSGVSIFNQSAPNNAASTIAQMLDGISNTYIGDIFNVPIYGEHTPNVLNTVAQFLTQLHADDQALASQLSSVAQIDDSSTGTDKTWSSVKIDAKISSAEQLAQQAINQQGAILTSLNSKASIDDTTPSPSKTFSSEKIMQKFAEIVGSAPANADTFEEVAAQIAALVQADQGLVSAASSQSFTSEQILQAQSNLNLAVNIDANGDNEFVTAMKAVINPTLWTAAHA